MENYFNSTFKRKPTKSLKKSVLSKLGKSPTAATKREIQAVLRDIVIIRDKGCILRSKRLCGGEIGFCVLQADHLITRGNSATYGDSRLVVCVCKGCHAWKSCGNNLNKAEYDALVRTILSPERVALWDMAEADRHRPYKADWTLVLLALQRELETMQ